MSNRAGLCCVQDFGFQKLSLLESQHVDRQDVQACPQTDKERPNHFKNGDTIDSLNLEFCFAIWPLKVCQLAVFICNPALTNLSFASDFSIQP